MAITEDKLELAAKSIIEQLPDHAGELIVNLSKQYQVPLWQYTCGILLAVHLEGRLSEFRLDPAWKEGLRQKLLKCQYDKCNQMFKARHINQPYCSNECGLLAAGVVPISKENIKNAVISKPKFNTTKPNPTGDWADPVDDTLEAA